MKRSEMIKTIATNLFFRDMANQHQFFYDEVPNPEEEDNWNTYLTDAKLLLTNLENAGMRPPLLLNQKYKGPLEGWESEDETT